MEMESHGSQADMLRISSEDLKSYSSDSGDAPLQRTWTSERTSWRSDLQALISEWLEDCTAAATAQVEADLVAASTTNSPEQACAPAVKSAASTAGLRERLRQAAPAKSVANRMDWSRLVAVAGEALLEAGGGSTPSASSASSGKLRRPPRCVDVNSGGQVFFGLLKPEGADGKQQEEAVVFKFCNARHRRQSEQMAAELAWHLEVRAPISKLLLRVHDDEWQSLKEVAAPLCEELGELLTTKQSMLVMQFIPAKDLSEEQEAWAPGHLANSMRALGRLLVLDMLLGNADRLPIASLSWRGNPSNVLWSADASPDRCAPIDALVARRPPRLKIQSEDKKIGQLLELILLDAESAHTIMLETVSCNHSAVAALEADWEARKKLRAAEKAAANSRNGSCVAGKDVMDLQSVNAVKAFHEGVRSALSLAAREQGLFEMVVDVIQSWFAKFHMDMRSVSSKPDWKSRTVELKKLSLEADKNDDVKERWTSWQTVIEEKSIGLRKAVQEWAMQRDVPTALSFKGFLGESMINPLVDVYELLVRAQQLIARIKVMDGAAKATRPCELSPSPLLVGPATSASCFHLLRKLGVTLILNCTEDLLEPSAADLGGDIKWHRLRLLDNEDQDMSAAFSEGLSLIDAAVNNGGRVLVHCHEGKSRSVTLCLAYLIARERRTLADALAFVKSKRPQARPNAGFWKQLVAFEIAELGTSTASQTEAPKGRPRGFVCVVCGELAGLTEEASGAPNYFAGYRWAT